MIAILITPLLPTPATSRCTRFLAAGWAAQSSSSSWRKCLENEFFTSAPGSRLGHSMEKNERVQRISLCSKVLDQEKIHPL